jgi:hypothetical protein
MKHGKEVATTYALAFKAEAEKLNRRRFLGMSVEQTVAMWSQPSHGLNSVGELAYTNLRINLADMIASKAKYVPVVTGTQYVFVSRRKQKQLSRNDGWAKSLRMK